MTFKEEILLPKKVVSDLENFTSKEEKYIWNSADNPTPSPEEQLIFHTENIYAMYEEKKIKESKLIWTSKRVILYGTEVRGTVVADMVSREYENIRGLSRSEKLLSPNLLGWSIPHESISKVEAIKLGERFSLYFFKNSHRLFLINDILPSEMEKITDFMERKNIEVHHDQFNLPLRDIFLLFCFGTCIFLIGLILIVIIF